MEGPFEIINRRSQATGGSKTPINPQESQRQKKMGYPCSQIADPPHNGDAEHPIGLAAGPGFMRSWAGKYLSRRRAAAGLQWKLAMQRKATFRNVAILLLALASVAAAQSTKIEQLRSTAEQGDAEAQSDLGLMYYMGEGVLQDYKEALKWFRLAADQGDTVAQNSLGVMHDNGKGVLQDHREALKWYRLAADQGNATAQFNLGLMYDGGGGVLQDYQEALKWYRLAADQGYASAQANLGLMYDKGRGVPQDYKEAAKWFRLAADQGNANAQANLGLMYDKGEGVPQDYKEAVKWYRLAAEQGEAAAQFNLGLMYHNGNGVPRDRIQAYKWFNLAASRATEEKTERYRSARDQLAKKMPRKKIAKAQRLAREWQPQTWEQLKDR